MLQNCCIVCVRAASSGGGRSGGGTVRLRAAVAEAVCACQRRSLVAFLRVFQCLFSTQQPLFMAKQLIRPLSQLRFLHSCIPQHALDQDLLRLPVPPVPRLYLLGRFCGGGFRGFDFGRPGCTLLLCCVQCGGERPFPRPKPR